MNVEKRKLNENETKFRDINWGLLNLKLQDYDGKI